MFLGFFRKVVCCCAKYILNHEKRTMSSVLSRKYNVLIFGCGVAICTFSFILSLIWLVCTHKFLIFGIVFADYPTIKNNGWLSTHHQTGRLGLISCWVILMTWKMVFAACPALCLALMSGCTETVSALCCHWLNTSAKFTVKAAA